ncbi:hypothetical protein pipiens_014946 [Culex pipiens pipiens]|uniref:Uncharacterized protein n=1 Tax=Culex pipiens pipiens TaxID=38569 RepID=A0ABD1CSG8_CULPP
MIQLRALNDTDTSEENSILNDCDNYKISGEAEETIVISEYIRALKLKDAKKYKAALSLLLELLGTNVLNKAPNDSKNDQILLPSRQYAGVIQSGEKQRFLYLNHCNRVWYNG